MRTRYQFTDVNKLTSLVCIHSSPKNLIETYTETHCYQMENSHMKNDRGLRLIWALENLNNGPTYFLPREEFSDREFFLFCLTGNLPERLMCYKPEQKEANK